MSFRPMIHHPIPSRSIRFRSIRTSCGDGGGEARDSAREPEPEAWAPAQEPERAREAWAAAEEAEAAAGEAVVAASELARAPYGMPCTARWAARRGALHPVRAAHRHRSSEAGRRRPSRRTRRRKAAAPSRRTLPLCASSSRAWSSKRRRCGGLDCEIASRVTPEFAETGRSFRTVVGTASRGPQGNLEDNE
jgi:hypothetical protein